MNTGRILWLPALLGLVLAGGIVNAQGIIDSKHNLTRSGPGTVKARPQIQSELCVFCHTPHTPKRNRTDVSFGWNRADSTATYITYESSTLYATVGQPSGASKLCLSCHDGTIALGSILSQRNVIPFQGDWENSPANLGTNLADDHPISFTYDRNLATANGQLADPDSLIGPIQLDAADQLQCTSCHDPHDDSNGMFLVVDDPVRKLCTTCHQPDGWRTNSHATSTAKWNSEGIDPWPHTNDPATTVADNVCQNCHQPHNAGKQEGLLSYLIEEANCLKCHNGNVAGTDIEGQGVRHVAFVGQRERARIGRNCDRLGLRARAARAVAVGLDRQDHRTGCIGQVNVGRHELIDVGEDQVPDERDGVDARAAGNQHVAGTDSRQGLEGVGHVVGEGIEGNRVRHVRPKRQREGAARGRHGQCLGFQHAARSRSEQVHRLAAAVEYLPAAAIERQLFRAEGDARVVGIIRPGDDDDVGRVDLEGDQTVVLVDDGLAGQNRLVAEVPLDVARGVEDLHREGRLDGHRGDIDRVTRDRADHVRGRRSDRQFARREAPGHLSGE